MTRATTRAFHPRALSPKERSFTRWLIEHANVGEGEKKKYLGQLEAATVVRMCDCGCASIDFAIAGAASEPGAPLDPFGDFIAKDKRFGVFVFSKHNTLAGVEIYSLADLDLPSEFPDPAELVGLEEANQPPEPMRAKGPHGSS
jgi:hypothetical protein